MELRCQLAFKVVWRKIMARCDVAIANPKFQPALRIISAITQANPASVTTSIDHNYTDGQIIRLLVPKHNGMVEINGKTGTITITGDATFTITIDSTSFTAFTVPVSDPWYINMCPQTIPVGEIASTLAGATENVLPYPAT